MIDTNRRLIRGVFDETKKKDVARKIRENRATDGRLRTFDAYAYPKFYIPPYNYGRKLQTIIPFSPKTNIVADNAYEFEILRLLRLFDPDDETDRMIEATKERLRHTCFGYKSCHYAECFEAGLAVLRFLSFAAADDGAWIKKQIDMYNGHYGDRRRHSGVQKYYWLILSDMPLEIAKPEIIRQKEDIIGNLSRAWTIKNGDEDVALCAMRNALSRLPEFEHIKNRAPHAGEKDGRLRFDLD